MEKEISKTDLDSLKLLKLASKVENQYQEGLQYKKQHDFFNKWAEYERFKAGDQWAKPTEKTKNLPRPVLNIIKQIINHKVASVMNENVRMVLTANDVMEEQIGQEAADIFTKLADVTWEKLKQDQLNEEALESGATNGLAIWHYYWDGQEVGGNALKYIGELKGEVIDSVNFFVGNPQNPKIENQPYIIISYRDLVENVQEEADANGMKVKIKADSETEDEAYSMAKQELTEDSKVTVLVKYWKEDKVVHFMKVAAGNVVKKPTSLNIKRYPVAVMQWERRKKSIFGVSDVEGLIPNQKAVNFLIAMNLLGIQNTGFPKVLVNKNTVRQQITNAPGEIINVNGEGGLNQHVQYLNPASMSSQAIDLINQFIQQTKDTAGANQSLLGEQQTSQLNASAIMLLQRAAGVPLESIKRRFYQAIEDIGLIWIEFFKSYYTMSRMLVTEDEEGNIMKDTVNASEYSDIDFHLKIDIGASSVYSETLMMTSLDKLFDMGHITLKQYLTYVPKNVIPFKDRLMKEVLEQEAMMQAQQQQMMAAEIEQLKGQFLQQLSPEEQAQFMAMPPEQQNAMVTEAMGGALPSQVQQQPQARPQQRPQPQQKMM